MRGPAEVDGAIEKKQAGALRILGGVEDDFAAGAVGAGAGISGGDLGGAAGEFSAGGDVERVKALMVVAAGSFVMPTTKIVPLGPALRSMTGVEVMPISGVIWPHP